MGALVLPGFNPLLLTTAFAPPPPAPPALVAVAPLKLPTNENDVADVELILSWWALNVLVIDVGLSKDDDEDNDVNDVDEFWIVVEFIVVCVVSGCENGTWKAK